jgi:hypothetical protein
MKPQQKQAVHNPPSQRNSTAIEKRSQDHLDKVPEYLRRKDGEPPMGLENLERQDMTLPRLGLCQALSPQRSKTDPKYIAGLSEGEFFNTITRENYGDRVQLVPLLFYKTRIYFNAMDDGGGLRCQSQDNFIGIGDPGGTCAVCPFSKFGSSRGGEGKGTACNQFFNYAALVVKDGTVSPEGLLVFSLKSSALRVAKEWNALLRHRNLDIFAGVYELTSMERKNDIGRWYEPIVTPAGNVSREVYEASKIAYAAVASLKREGRLQADVIDLEREPGAEG